MIFLGANKHGWMDGNDLVKYVCTDSTLKRRYFTIKFWRFSYFTCRCRNATWISASQLLHIPEDFDFRVRSHIPRRRSPLQIK